ncbi:hypothetical protein ACHAWF_003862, partial [Thalassiosira exigua]
TDAISVPKSTTLLDLANFAAALLGIDDGGGGGGGGGGGVVLARGQSRTPLHRPGAGGADAGGRTLAQCGVGDGELISAYAVREFEAAIAAGGAGSPARRRPRTDGANAGTNANANAGGGGLDFSSLLGAAGAAPAAPAGGMDFSALLSSAGAANAAAAPSSTGGGSAAGPVRWEGMTLDDAVERNPNPLHLMTLLSDEARHPNLMKELNYHNPQVAKRLLAAKGDVPKMAEAWRETAMKSAAARFLHRHTERSKEREMEQRLRRDATDAEANKYFGEKIRLENVQRQYERMMEEYPESMGRVLMLYVDCKVDGKPLQVFVDSGAQQTIMSSECADRLGLLRLVDDRFAGVAVGVGTGKILGRIHVVELEIGGCVFQCSVTVMDSKEGLGDKNMDCLFGLDMLKRHRCCIDLGSNVLRFGLGGGGGTMEAPFLHEKDLPTSKGGTRGFDAERENAEVEARFEKMEEDDKEDERGGDGGSGEGGGSEGAKGK